MEFMEWLNKDAYKKRQKGHFLYIWGRAVLIDTIANLLDAK